MNSTFFWMNENSIGILKNIILEVDFNIYDKKIQIVDVSGNFKCEDVKISYMEGMPEITGINANAIIQNSKVSFDISSGNSSNLEVISGFVNLYNLDTDNEKGKDKFKYKFWE